MKLDLLFLTEDAVLVVTGGKIDNAKNIHLLMKAVSDINCDKINLLVFGQPHESVKGIIDAYSKSPHIRNIGWIPSDQVYDYFLASDLAVFPGTHSVLWEQACACGLPIVVRDWPGMHHIDMDGNAIFLHEDSAEEIERVLLDLYNTPNKLSRMKIAAMEKCVSMFSYRRIASQAIMEDEFK